MSLRNEVIGSAEPCYETEDVAVRSSTAHFRRVLNIVVYYDNYDEVLKYVNSVRMQSGGVVDIAVVANKDSENRLKELKTQTGNYSEIDIRYWSFEENVGYLNSLLYVLKEIDLSSYDYFILSNTDISYISDDFFTMLAQTEYEEMIGCIAPSVYSTKTKSYSNPHYVERVSKRHFKRLLTIFSYPFLGKLYVKLASMKSRLGRVDEPASRYVYSPHGCYMIFTQSFSSKLKDFEYGVKLYSEESYIGELLCMYNMRCYYDSRLKVEHRENTVTGKMPSKKQFQASASSIRYILDTFYKEQQ